MHRLSTDEPPQDKPHTAQFFDAMFRSDADPWNFKSRWYEIRKRQLTMACLPDAKYSRAFEPGCANGELSAALAPRCGRLLCSDGSTLAVQAARLRLAHLPQVEIKQLWVPDQWPDYAFELVVISELAYYLDADQLNELIACAKRVLTPDGTVLACHWRHPIDDCAIGGDHVHDAFARSLKLPSVCTHIEADFRIDVWSSKNPSIAAANSVG